MLQVYTMKNKEEWDSIVKSFNLYDVYYLSGYLNGFKIHGDGEPLLFYYEDDCVRGINVVMKRDIASFVGLSEYINPNIYYDLTTVYGYGGWIIEKKIDKDISLDFLNEEYITWCKENEIISEFVRFHPLLGNYELVSSIYDVVHLGSTVYMDITSEDIIWQNMTSKNRNMIRKANKSGLKTCYSQDPKMIESFMEIYNATMDKDNATDYYYFKKEYYDSVLLDLGNNAMWFYTMLDETIVAISIFLYENGNMHYHLSGSRREYQNLAPTNLLLYEAAKWGTQNGYKKLHLGGGVGAAQDSLYKFKKAFNRNEDKEFCIGKKIFNEEIYNELVDIRKANENGFDTTRSFFPLYRV